MDFYPEESYHRVCKVFLQWLGIWHNDSSTLKFVKAFVAYTTLFTSLCTQFASLSSDSNVDNILSVLAVAIPNTAAVMKYTCFLIQTEKIRVIWDTIRRDWHSLRKDKDALEILHGYGEETRFLSISFLSIGLFGSVFLSFLALPAFLDFVMPLNETRSKTLVIDVNYFVDHEKYHYTLFLHIWFTFTVGVFTILATEVSLLVFVQHACAVLKITGYKLERALDGLERTCARTTEREHIIYKNVTDAVKIHSNGIRLVDFIWETFGTSYIILIFFGVFSISINMFRFFRAVTMGAGYRKMFGCCCFFLGQFAHMFFGNLFAQRLIDCSTEIFDKTYSAAWYDAPIQTQKLLLFILHRTMKKTAFVAASVFTASLEGFSTLASTSFSYFTVIYSML